MPTVKLIGNITLYDKIVQYMNDPSDPDNALSPKQKEQCDRWIQAYSIMRNYNNLATTVKRLAVLYPHLSRMQLYRDCGNAEKLFGEVNRATKEGIRHLSTEIIKDAIAMARLQRKPGVMINGAFKMAVVNNAMDIDIEMPDFKSDMAKHEYRVALNQDGLDALRKLTGMGHIDLDQGMLEDIDYQELPDDNSTTDADNTETDPENTNA